MAKKVTVRLMVPFSMQCDSCKTYIYKSTKFNARKTQTKESYLGVPIFSFEFRCSGCSAPIEFRTDPESRDYKLVSGAHTLAAADAMPAARPTRRVVLELPRPVARLPKPKPRKHLRERAA